MFADEQIKAYRNIKAPNELRKKIVKPQSNKKWLYTIIVVAACFIFMITGILIDSQHNNIVINGQQLKSSIEFYDTAPAFERTVSSAVSIPVEIKVSQDTNISVDKGVISIDGSDSTKEICISDSAIIWWEFEPTEDSNVFEMLISNKKGVQKLTLEYDNAKITVTKEKEK